MVGLAGHGILHGMIDDISTNLGVRSTGQHNVHLESWRSSDSEYHREMHGSHVHNSLSGLSGSGNCYSSLYHAVTTMTRLHLELSVMDRVANYSETELMTVGNSSSRKHAFVFVIFTWKPP
jgi:hypothetical protein